MFVMKIGVVKSPNAFPYLFKTVNGVCIALLMFASFSAQAERIRRCYVDPGVAAVGYDYNGNLIQEIPGRLSVDYYTAGRHGGVQPNTARKRAVRRFKTCVDEVVKNVTKNVEHIAECNNENVGTGGFDMSDFLGRRSLKEYFACPHGLFGNLVSGDIGFFFDVREITVSGKTSGDKFCSSSKSKTVSVNNMSQFHCKGTYYNQYSFRQAISNPFPSFFSSSIAMMNGMKSIKEILGSESDVEKIFGAGHKEKASKLLTMLDDAAANRNTNALIEWLPHVSEYEEKRSKILRYNDLDVDSIDGKLPNFQTVYDRSKNAIYFSDQLNNNDEKEIQCSTVQALAQHVSHYFDGFNGLKTDRVGSEGMLAALRVCKPTVFASLTDRQIRALQSEASFADIRLQDKYDLKDVGLSFNLLSGTGTEVFALNSLLPESAKSLLTAPIVTVANQELELEELSKSAHYAQSLNLDLVVKSSGYEEIVGTSEAIASANSDLSAVAILGRPYDASKRHDFTGDQLRLAHLHLNAAGYRFVGYRWEPEAHIAEETVNNRVVLVDQPEYEEPDANFPDQRQWRGLNVSENIELVSGYINGSRSTIGNRNASGINTAQTGRLLRVYLPSADANNLFNIGPDLNTPAAARLARELAGTDIEFVDTDELTKSYLFRGRVQGDYMETIISWPLAHLDTIVIPAARQIDPNTFELEAINTANRWEQSVPTLGGRSDILQ
ncbi:hypothetical protein CBF23_006585 [Marinomonas agarivorans]|nr:hypothetical protein CBF23_006585 [Marinomonas agarivorans]